MTATIITTRDGGPLHFKGELTLKGEPIEGGEAWLCRCGATKNGPWCDGSHKSAGIPLTGAPAKREGRDISGVTGPVNLDPQPNGSVRASGPMIVQNAAGEEIDRTPQASFCRCGQTAKAPYCDGSHKKAGFVAP